MYGCMLAQPSNWGLSAKVIYLWYLNSCALENLVNLIWSFWTSCACIKKVIHKLDIVLCDGKTIKAEMLTDQPGHYDVHKFPTQHPTPADLNHWKLTLHKLSSDFHVFTVKLQEYISPPHNHPWWMLNNYETNLHHNIVQGDKTYHEEYTPSSNPIDCRTRGGTTFQLYNCEEWSIWFWSVCKHYSFSAAKGSLTLLGTRAHIFTSNLWIWTCD